MCPAWSLWLNATKPGSGAGGLGVGVSSLTHPLNGGEHMFSFLEG